MENRKASLSLTYVLSKFQFSLAKPPNTFPASDFTIVIVYD
jgi:hypothetical protein